GDTEKTIEALTTILNAATNIVESLSSGDTFCTVKNIASIIGEGVGQLAGIPGLGNFISAAFDFGNTIGQAISDAFSGASPAARAIRAKLAPAIASAFSSGIMSALRGEADWRENIKDGVKIAFLPAMIETFIQSA